MKVLVRAPSNIALIKYMGKSDASLNLPENGSLSMTLEDLCTWVEIERVPGAGDALLLAEAPRGAPMGVRPPALSAEGRAKALKHVERVRDLADEILPMHGIRAAPRRSTDLVLRTANTFPEASGIASSASSFAGITLAVALARAEDPAAFERAWERDPGLRWDLARVSRQGSGSSCRSFEGPFVLWEGEEARALPAALPELAHFVILISSEPKAVTSSQAHARVKTSPLWEGRRERVARRLEKMRHALEAGNLSSVARFAWSESWEMHSLFHTASEPFSYWKPGSIEALEWLSTFVAGETPPVVTMDAGPNVHVIVPASRAGEWKARLSEKFGADAILQDRPGRGARIVEIREGVG